MKSVLEGLIMAVCMISSIFATSAEIIDQRTVYAPGINICVSSFGGIIQSSEILVLPQAKIRMTKSKQLLERWISDYDYPGFYLKEFDPAQFYWQFVETRKYVGAILIVTGEKIQADFYTSLGGGLNIHGRNFYGLKVPGEVHGEVYSFVINKETVQLDHFENWRFTEESDEPLEMAKLQTRQLVTQGEFAWLNGLVLKRNLERTRSESLAITAAFVGYKPIHQTLTRIMPETMSPFREARFADVTVI